jgi:hypothetical protein
MNQNSTSYKSPLEGNNVDTDFSILTGAVLKLGGGMPNEWT